MAIYVLRETAGKGYRVFAARDIKQGAHIFHIDLNEFEKYTLAELERTVEENPGLDGDHANYVGHGKYVIEDTPAAYMNHSCDPSCYFKMKSIAVYDVHALRDIAEGEELTHDYTANSIDQFAGQGFWVLECQCRSKNCRGEAAFWEFRSWQALSASLRQRFRCGIRGTRSIARLPEDRGF